MTVSVISLLSYFMHQRCFMNSQAGVTICSVRHIQFQHEEKQAWHHVVFVVEEKERVVRKVAAGFHAEPWEDMLVQQQGYKRMPLRGINLWFGMREKRKKSAIFSLKESLPSHLVLLWKTTCDKVSKKNLWIHLSSGWITLFCFFLPQL